MYWKVLLLKKNGAVNEWLIKEMKQICRLKSIDSNSSHLEDDFKNSDSGSIYHMPLFRQSTRRLYHGQLMVQWCTSFCVLLVSLLLILLLHFHNLQFTVHAILNHCWSGNRNQQSLFVSTYRLETRSCLQPETCLYRSVMKDLQEYKGWSTFIMYTE